jgi:osmotically inducible protein OsmC
MAIVRKADAVWAGSVREGTGQVSLGSGAFAGPYSFKSRFEGNAHTNPEELIGAAHAACFSMALSASLGAAGFTPAEIKTTAAVTLVQEGGGFTITRIDLTTRAKIPGIDAAQFATIAEGAKKNCPVSKALAGVATIHLDAALV